MLHIPPTNLLLLPANQEPYKKASLFMKNIGKFSRKVQDSVTGLGRKNIRGDSKKESNESPEIPDMYSASFQHGNLHLLLMETSRVTLLHGPK